MSSDLWKAAHGKGMRNRPGIGEIKAFLPEEVGGLFEEFAKHLAREYGIHCRSPVYTEADGWVFAFGRSNVTLINRVTIEDGAFAVMGQPVSNQPELAEAIAHADHLYQTDYVKRYAADTAVVNERQKQANQRRVAREKAELEALSGQIDSARFNQYRWSPKLSRNKLKTLYVSDAKGIQDEALLDDVGYTLFARCLQGRDERVIVESCKLKCHHCQAILEGSRTLITCPCGYQYLVRDYLRAFHKENMPSGAATPIFNAFLVAWPRAKGYAEKMRLVDGLVHEFHINLTSGVKGRFVGINLIEGSKKQIETLILELAYGDSSQQFMSNLNKE